MRLLKKVNCLILSFVFIFISAFAVSLTVKAETIKLGVINEPGEVMMGVVLRSDASKTSDKIITLWTGETLTIIDSKRDITGANYTWYQGSIFKNGVTYTGYIREDMIIISEYIIDPTFEQQLADFPKSYHDDLIKLHAIYPNWVFRADKINLTFNQAVALEDFEDYKLIDNSSLSLRSMRRGCYDWNTSAWIAHDSGRWYGASRELIAYYMDPRNFLNANDIYVFMQQQYDANSQTIEGLNSIIKNTFLEKGYNDPNDTDFGGSYANVIMEAAKQSSVSPYIIASTIIQEQGTEGTSSLISGNLFTYNNSQTVETFEGVYNFFNFGASGNSQAQVIRNGLNHAKNNGWTTRSKSIIEGAKKYGKNYISIGQDTYFYKNYNIIGPTNINHQYAQNVADQQTSAKKLAKVYTDNHDIKLTFRIPVYKDDSLPNELSPYPEKNDKLNNYYFKDIQADGLTPSYQRFTYDYSLSVNSDTSVYVELLDGTSIVSDNTFNLVQGDNSVVLKVKSQTGFTNDYVINVSASAPCTLTVTTDKTTLPEPTPVVLKGDTNGDGKITTSDLANVRLHLLGLISLDITKTGVDTNGDGKITTSDLANVRLHLLGLINLNP